MKGIAVFLGIIFIFSLPFLAFNYFIYKEKGITDFQFTRIFKAEKAQSLFGGLAGQDKNFVQCLFTLGNYVNYNIVWKTDPIICLFAILGIIIMIKKREKLPLAFIGIIFLIPFILQSAGSALTKHFAFMHILFAIAAGYGLDYILSKTNKKYLKLGIILLIMAALLAGLGNHYGAPPNYLDKSGTSSLKSFINKNVKNADLVLLDSRIYTARAFWIAMDHNLLMLQDFPTFYEYNLKLNNSRKIMTNVYLVECAIDDCGWGTIVNSPNLNKSSELLISQLANHSEKSYSIEGYLVGNNDEFFGSKQKVDEYRVYLLKMPLNPELVSKTKQINSFYFAPYMYLNMKGYIFNYDVYGFDALVNKLSLFIIYISVIITIFSLIGVIFFL